MIGNNRNFPMYNLIIIPRVKQNFIELILFGSGENSIVPTDQWWVAFVCSYLNFNLPGYCEGLVKTRLQRRFGQVIE
jgi:hypothetical protein